MSEYHVGVSGWSYDSWRGDFYPEGLPRRAELAYLAERVTSIEVNATFYSLRSGSWFRDLLAQTEGRVVLPVKGSRYITHMKRLRDVGGALANFFASGPTELGDRLGPVLWQLPERLAFDADRVGAFLERLPRSTAEAARLARGHDDRVPDPVTSVEVDRRLAHVLEPRHASFGSDEALALLRAQGVGLVRADSGGKWPELDEDTSDVRYARLHGHTRLYASGYSSRSLDAWAATCRAWHGTGREVFVHFDNDAEGHAPHDAVALLGRLEPGRAVRSDG
jgi:uncharacterized protein YecE (DUF72 family)